MVTISESPVLVVCERGGRWAAAIRLAIERMERHGEPAAPGYLKGSRLVETRSPLECQEALDANPQAVAILELTADGAAGALRLLSEIGLRRALVCAVVVADRGMADYEWLARELGAAHFLSSPRRLDELFAIARRHVHGLPSAPRRTGEEILDNLPWR